MTHRDLYIGLEQMLFTANPIYEYELKFSSMQLIRYLELAQTNLINTLSLQNPQESTNYELLKNTLIKSLTIPLITNLDNISGYVNIPKEAIKVYGVKLNCNTTYNFSGSITKTLPVICDIVEHYDYTKGLIHTDDMSAVIRTPKLTITESKILFTKDQYTTVDSVEIHYVVQPPRFTIDTIQTKVDGMNLISSPLIVDYSDTLADLIIETAFKLMISEGVAVFSSRSNQ